MKITIFRKLNKDRKEAIDRHIDSDKDTDILSKVMKRIMTLNDLKIDVELTHNIIRGQSVYEDDPDDDINYDNFTLKYSVPKCSNYIKSLQGMKLIFDNLLNEFTKQIDKDTIERENKEYSKMVRSLIRMLITPKQTNPSHFKM